MNIILIVFFLWMFLLIGKSYIKSATFKGKYGEWLVNKQLKKLNANEYVYLHDLYLYHNERTVQIDHVVISLYGIFVIETKHRKGMIKGKEQEKDWLQILYKRKNIVYNPIRQNYGHVKTVQELLKYENLQFDMHSVIVFPNDVQLRVDSEKVMIYKKLNKYIQSFKEPKCSIQEVTAAYNVLSQENITDKHIRKQHIKQVKRIVKEKKKNR